jgi:hypothetical protein
MEVSQRWSSLRGSTNLVKDNNVDIVDNFFQTFAFGWTLLAFVSDSSVYRSSVGSSFFANRCLVSSSPVL